MAKRKLTLITESLPVPYDNDIPDIAWYYSCKVYPHNESLRTKWLSAVHYLRQTKKGWHIDRPPERLEKRSH